MKNLLISILSIFTLSCTSLKVDLPKANGIRGYSGSNTDSIRLIAIENSSKISQFNQSADLKWGLAMSGGGVRSASFNIGALKALYDIGFLDSINIISTVSGGSYASGWLYSHGLLVNPNNIGDAMFNENVILKNICELQNNANMMKLTTMSRTFFLTPNMAFNKYKKGIQRSFLSDSLGYGNISLMQTQILSRQIPQLIINTTVSSSHHNDWLPKIFEYTPFNRGNPEIGFENFNGNQSVPLNEAITISGAALKFKLLRKTNNYSSYIQGKYIPLSDGGHSENLGAISLIRRGVKNIIIIDAEHNKDYSFDAYKILKDDLKKQLGLDLSIPSIDSFIKGEVINLKTSVHVGKIETIYINPNNTITPLIINIYYVKMALPGTIKQELRNISIYHLGDSLNAKYIECSCELFNKKKDDCKHYNSALINMSSTVSDFNAMSVYWVKHYSDWLNNDRRWKTLNYTFPHTTTGDQCFYRDQMAAFIGLGYLEALELQKYLIK